MSMLTWQRHAGVSSLTKATMQWWPGLATCESQVRCPAYSATPSPSTIYYIHIFSSAVTMPSHLSLSPIQTNVLLKITVRHFTMRQTSLCPLALHHLLFDTSCSVQLSIEDSCKPHFDFLGEKTFSHILCYTFVCELL